MNILQFSKDNSTFVKGIAILMMLFLHLFNKLDYSSLYTSYIYLHDKPLPYCISKAMNPVGIFLFLSGFGLYKSWSQKKYGFVDTLHRLPRLYIVYWIILMIYIPIGMYLGVESYPGTFKDIILNFTAIRTTYNGEAWFLMPYILLSITSLYLFGLIDKVNNWLVFLLSLLIYYSIALIYGRFWTSVYNNTILLLICRYFETSCAFVMGALCAKIRDYKIKSKANILFYISLIIILLMTLYSTFYGMPVPPVYSAVLSLLLVVVSKVISKYSIYHFFIILGNYSFPMWLIHTFYSKYVFKDFIYSFRYPIIIFLVLIIVSIVSAYIVMRIANPIINHTIRK